jgi:hypothetical protein
MKLLPEHETVFTIVSKLVQVLWTSFELPTDEYNTSMQPVHDDDTSTGTGTDKSKVLLRRDWMSDVSLKNIPDQNDPSANYDHIVPDLQLIDDMMSWEVTVPLIPN